MRRHRYGRRRRSHGRKRRLFSHRAAYPRRGGYRF